MPKLSDWFLDEPQADTREVVQTYHEAHPAVLACWKKAEPKPRGLPYAEVFEVQCHTVFGPLPKLTPRTEGNEARAKTVGCDTPTGWLPGEQLHRHRLGYVDYDWRDL